MLGTSPHASSRSMGRRRRRRSSNESSDFEDSTSEVPIEGESMEKSVSEHDRETYQEESTAVSECSSACRRPLPVANALEVSSEESLSDPSVRAALLLRMQRVVPVVLLSKLAVAGEVCHCAQRERYVVSIPFWKLAEYRWRLETSESGSNADGKLSCGSTQEGFVQSSDGDSRDDEEMSNGSSHLQRDDWFTQDSEEVVSSQEFSANEDDAGGELEEITVTPLSTNMHVQPMVVPECGLFGIENEDQLQLIERVSVPFDSLCDLPPDDQSSHSPDESTSLPKDCSSVGPKRKKRRMKDSTLSASESSVASHSSKEQFPPVGSPRCVSESVQESNLDLPKSSAMNASLQLPAEYSSTIEHLPDGSISSDPPQSPMEHHTACSSTNCASVELTTNAPMDDRTSNGESGILVKCEAFHTNFKSTERYSFDVPLEYPNCARVVPITYHFQKPSTYLQRSKEKAERRQMRKLYQQEKNGAHLTSFPATAGGAGCIKQEPFFEDDCSSGKEGHAPHHMEPSTPSTSAPTVGKEVPPVTQSALSCACLPPTPPEQMSKQTLGTADLSVKDLLSQFTEGNNEGTEEEKEGQTDNEEMAASNPHTLTEAGHPVGRGSGEMFPWLVSGESNDVSVGRDAEGGGKRVSTPPPNLELLTPSTLESQPSGKGGNSGMTGEASVNNNSFSSSPCQMDQIMSESPLPSKRVCEEVEGGSLRDEHTAICSDSNVRSDKDSQALQDDEKKTAMTASITQDICAPVQEIKRKVGRPRKSDKGRTVSARTSVTGSKASPPDQSASDALVTAQKSPREVEVAPHDDGCAASEEHNTDDSRDIHRTVGSKDGTVAAEGDGSSVSLQQGTQRKVGRPRKGDRTSPTSASVASDHERDAISKSRKRTRSTSEPASLAKRSRNLSPPVPEKDTAASSKDFSPAEETVQSPNRVTRHSARLLAADRAVQDASGSPTEPTSTQEPPDEPPGSLNTASPVDEKPVNLPVTTGEVPVTEKKKGRKIKLRVARQTAQLQQQTTHKVLKGNAAGSSQSASDDKMGEPSRAGARTTGSQPADMQQGYTPYVDIPFTFNLEKNQERLSSALRLPAEYQREPATNTTQPPNPAAVSFSFVVPGTKTQPPEPNLETKAEMTTDTEPRLDEAWVSNSDSPPPPLPQTPSSSISAYQPSPANSIGDIEVRTRGAGVARKPEEGDLLELHPQGDFDDMSLLGDGAQAAGGELLGFQSKAVKCTLKGERKGFLKPEGKHQSTRLKVPPQKLGIGRMLPPPLPPNTSPTERNQRVRDWVEGISREPPLPPPHQLLLKTPDRPLQPEEDEEFVSASIVNGPVVMATYSEPAHPPSYQHAPEPRGRASSHLETPGTSYRRWNGFCRLFILNVPCMRKPCYFQHCLRADLPSEVLHHLAMVERVGNLTEKPMQYLTDDNVLMLDHILQGLHSGDLMSVWRIKTELHEKRIFMTTQFYESFLNAVTALVEIPDAVMHFAEQTFFHLQSMKWRKEAHRVMDCDNIISCHLKRNEIQSVCDVLFRMAEQEYTPSVETIELFIVAVKRAHSVDTDGTIHMVKAALHCVVKYVSCMPNIMNQFFPILLKTPQAFVEEVRILLHCVMENDLYAFEMESIIPVIKLCLCHSWVPELEHVIGRCHFVNLLPTNTLQAVLQAVSGGRVPVGSASHIVGNMSEEQRRHVDPQIWVGLMENFCQYGKANMVVKIQQICKELELTVPDMVLWEVMNYFVRVHNVSAASDVFLQLKELQPSFFNARCVSSIWKTLKETKDYVALYRILKKLLEHKMTDHVQELIPVFQWLLDNNLVKEISCLVILIHSCRDSLRLPPRPVLEQAERKLVEWGKSDEALDKVAEMLGKVVHRTATVVPEEKIPSTPNALLPHHAKDLTAQSSPATPIAPSAGLPATHNNKERLNLIEGILREGEWDVAALMIVRKKPLPEQVGPLVFRVLVQLTGHSDMLSSSLTQFIKGFQLAQSTASAAALEEPLKDLVARVGVSLILHCCSTLQWVSGFAVLQCLHSHGLHYVQYDPVVTHTTQMYTTEGSRMMAAAKICLETCPGMAITVLHGCNWKPVEPNDEEGIKLVKDVVPPLVRHHLDQGELPTAYELLGHMGKYLEGAAEELYFVLFDKFLSMPELEKACEVAIFLLKQWKRVRKVKLVELLIRLQAANMVEMKGQVLRLALEAGVLQRIACGRIAKGTTKEESAILLEQHLEDLCLLYSRLKDVTLTFSDADSLRSSLDYLRNYLSPPLQGCKVNDAHLPPSVTFPAYTIEAWRRANVNKSLWGSKGCKQQRNFRSPPTQRKQWGSGGDGETGRRQQPASGRPYHWPHLSPSSHLSQPLLIQSTSSCSQSPTDKPLVPQQVQGVLSQMLTGHSPPLSPSTHHLKVMGHSPPVVTPSAHPNNLTHQPMAQTDGKNVKAWKRQWRMAVSKEVHSIVYPYKSTKFTSKDDRQYFVQSIAMKFSKSVEHREEGPWHLTAPRKQMLQEYMRRILDQFTLYTTEVADQLNL